MSQSQVRTNAEKYNFTAEKAHFAKSSRQGLESLRSDLPRLEFHADHDAVRIINNGQMLYKLSPIAEGLSPRRRLVADYKSPIFMGHEWSIFKNSNDAGVCI